MTDHQPEQFNLTHPVTGLDTGDRWGIPDTPSTIGVLRVVGGTSAAHVTLIVDYEYAETLAEAVEMLDGEILVGSSAIRWMRRGWPSEWETHCEPNAWRRVADGRIYNLPEGGAE